LRRARARKIIFSLTFVSLLAGSARGEPRFEAGFYLGVRRISDGDLRRAFGNSLVYSPQASVFLGRSGLFCGAAYEGGRLDRSAAGLGTGPGELKVTGFELFVGYQPQMRPVVPYAKVGYGSYNYKFVFDNPSVGVLGIDGTKGAILVGAGIKIFLFELLFLGGEIRYLPLTVTSPRIEVDLGGTRILGGIGIYL
jgi:hypothetical protein